MDRPPTSGPGAPGPERRSVRGAAGQQGAAGGPSWASTGARTPASRTAGGNGPRPAGTGGGRRAAASASAGAGRTARKGGRGKRRLIDYPRYGKTGVRRWLPSWKLVLGTFATFGLIGLGAFAWLYASTKIPSPAEFADAQTTTVFYADGTTKMGTFGVQNRVIVDAAEIPQVMKDAIVAGEDRTFYTNPGIDPVGIARALWNNLRGGDRQGGSSITQQYAERYFFSSTVDDYKGKLQEAILAIKLDRQQDKDQILSNYLNTIYFGRDSYGIETAARSYFGVGVAELNVSQAALLAGVVPSPNNFDPRVSPEQAERRWNYVLDGMVTMGTLSQADRDAQVFPAVVEYSRSDIYAGPQGYLLSMVRDEILASTAITEEELDQRGYSITTTVDPALQQMLVDAVSRVPADHAPNMRTAAVTLAPADGAILALYGGPDYLTQSRNAVTQDAAQAGSTFKPLTLTAYLENGGSLKSRYSGANRIPVEGFPEGVRNFSNENFGRIDVVTATAKSVNAVYAQMNVEVGPAATLDAARRGGIPDSALEGQEVPSNVLGTATVHPLDMAEVYNTFAAEGLHTKPFIVRTITYLDGRAVFTGGATPERVYEADVMADVTYAMQQVVAPGGSASKVSAVGYPVAGKTGTSNENRSAWFIGFTRQLTTAVAMYQVGPNGEQESITPFGPYVRTVITGGSAPADLWTDYMTNAMAGRERQEFPEPAYVGEPNVPPVVAVPDVRGMSEADAQAALGAAGLVPASATANDPNVPAGQVISSDPPGGTQVDQGTTVTIVVSAGPGTAEVPAVIGLDVREARSRLEGAGFAVAVEEVADEDAPEGEVLGSSPGGGTQAAPGSTVTLRVSSGPATGGGGGGGGGPTPTPTPTLPAPGGGNGNGG